MRQFRIWGIIPLPLPLLVRVHHQMIGGQPKNPAPEVVVRKKWVWKLFNSDALLGDSAAEFANMTRATATPLNRIPRPPVRFDLTPLVSLCVSFCVSF
jgi:hypothetical protein